MKHTKDTMIEEFLGGRCDDRTPYIDKNDQVQDYNPGTYINGLGTSNKIMLGMPKGFNKANLGGMNENIAMFMYESIEELKQKGGDCYGKLNLPCWYIEEQGCLFIKMFSPRVNHCWMQIIGNATFKQWKDSGFVGMPLNVAKFQNEID